MTDFFWAMPAEEARTFLSKYEGWRRERLPRFVDACMEAGLAALDYSPRSLVILWDWALNHLCNDDNHGDLSLGADIEDWLWEWSADLRKLSSDKVALLNDIAAYFAEVVIENIPGVHWAVGDAPVDRYVFQNQPVLSGLSIDRSPMHQVLNAAWSALRGQPNPDALYEVFVIMRESARPGEKGVRY